MARNRGHFYWLTTTAPTRVLVNRRSSDDNQVDSRQRGGWHPTVHIWREPEHVAGPLLLQADHGPAAFRNVRVRPLRQTEE